MNKYKELSDFEINVKVANYDLLCDYNINEHKKVVELTCSLGDNNDEYFVYGEFDPCNNPYYAMPIIIDNKIAMTPAMKETAWVCGHYPFYATSDNPSRACMEVFLMMKDEENKND